MTKDRALFPKIVYIYRHFKGGEYIVIGEAQHTETLETLVLYQEFGRGYPSLKIWARPRDMFYQDEVVLNSGVVVSRFEKVGYIDRQNKPVYYERPK